MQALQYVRKNGTRLALIGMAIAIAIAFLGSMAVVLLTSSDNNTTAAAAPKTVQTPSKPATKPQPSKTAATTTSTPSAWQALPAGPDYPKGLPQEESYTPAKAGEQLSVGRGSEMVFTTAYPAGWKTSINPSGKQYGENGELNFVASNGALVGFTSLKAPVGSNYGNDPLGWMRGHLCNGNGGINTEESVTVKFVTAAPASMQATYVAIPCRNGMDNYVWYSQEANLLVLATDGPDGEDSSEIVGVVQLMLDRGTLPA